MIFNSRAKRTGEKLTLDLEFDADKNEYSLISQIVDEDTCNPLKLWHAMGEPSSLDDEQVRLLRQSDKPLTVSNILSSKDGKVKASFDVNEFGLVFFELKPYSVKPDRGYDYNRVIS